MDLGFAYGYFDDLSYCDTLDPLLKQTFPCLFFILLLQRTQLIRIIWEVLCVPSSLSTEPLMINKCLLNHYQSEPELPYTVTNTEILYPSS